MSSSSKSKGSKGGQEENIFRNDVRVNALIDCVKTCNKERMIELIEDRSVNSKVYKKLKGKSVTWEDLKDEVVWHIIDASSNSHTVMKTFDSCEPSSGPEEEGSDFPFHEMVGNLLGTDLLRSVGPFFVRLYDIGRFVDTGEYFILLEYIPSDTEELDLEDPIVMYNLFYQICYVIHQMSITKHQLQHFDMRFDNIMIKKLPSGKKRDLFKNGYCVSDFIVKVGDWGQCEFNWDEKIGMKDVQNNVENTDATKTSLSDNNNGNVNCGSSADNKDNKNLESGTGACQKYNRLINENVPREEEYRKKWGFYPETYSHGYDFQYFMGTLTPVLDNLQGLSFYYVYNMVMDYMQPMTFTSAQDRPEVITEVKAINIFNFLKKEVFPTLDLSGSGEDGNKENENI